MIRMTLWSYTTLTDVTGSVLIVALLLMQDLRNLWLHPSPSRRECTGGSSSRFTTGVSQSGFREGA